MDQQSSGFFALHKCPTAKVGHLCSPAQSRTARSRQEPLVQRKGEYLSFPSSKVSFRCFSRIGLSARKLLHFAPFSLSEVARTAVSERECRSGAEPLQKGGGPAKEQASFASFLLFEAVRQLNAGVVRVSLLGDFFSLCASAC